MGAPKMPSTPETPPPPAPVQRASSEQAKVRTEARDSAVKRAGISGTDVTQGKLEGVAAETLKRKLGQ